MTATTMLSAPTPLTCRVNGPLPSSNLTTLRIPSQPCTPLNDLALRNCPFCTTSSQAPADRLTEWSPAVTPLDDRKPAKVPSFGARSGGVGRPASFDAFRLILPANGSVVKSLPDA